MGVHSEFFEFEAKGEFDVVNLTGRVEEAVRNSGISEGIAVVFAGHATGVIILNEYDPALLEDLRSFMRETFPAGEGY